jgi:Protein of unknown function (DUF2934)
MTEREQRVREIAHRLWEDEGRPSDQEKRHWATAESMFEAEKTVGARSDATPPREEAQTASATGTGKRRTASKSARRTPVGSETSATRPH